MVERVVMLEDIGKMQMCFVCGFYHTEHPETALVCCSNVNVNSFLDYVLIHMCEVCGTEYHGYWTDENYECIDDDCKGEALCITRQKRNKDGIWQSE